MILLDQVPGTELFSEADRLITDAIGKLNITAREKWNHANFAKIYSKIKKTLKTQQKSTCFYCQVRNTLWALDDWHIDHIVPLDEDSRHVFTSYNLILACKGCNRLKNDKDVLVDKLSSAKYSKASKNYRIVHGKIDKYSEHIVIFAGRLYASKSPKGRRLLADCVLDRFALDFITNIKDDDRAFVEAGMRILMSGNPRDLVALALTAPELR